MNTKTKSEAVAQTIRRRVLSGTYPRGSRLRQDQLAVELGVSSTPVREALRVLQSEGLLVAEPHRGVRVVDSVDVELVRGAYVVRRLVESFAVRRAVHRLSPQDLDDLEAGLDAAEHGPPDREPAHAANVAFHFGLYRHCGLPALTAEIERLWTAFPWDLMLADPARLASSRIEHRAILNAARGGDPAAVVAAFDPHRARGRAARTRQSAGAAADDPFDLP